jgi:hypothetical protein
MNNPYIELRLRAAINSQLRNRQVYTIENVSCVWNLLSCKGIHLPKCRGGILYPKGKSYKDFDMIVFITDPQYNNWAEDNGLDVRHKWINEHHEPLIESGSNSVNHNSVEYEDVYEQLSELIEQSLPNHKMATILNIGQAKCRKFAHRYISQKGKYGESYHQRIIDK